MATLENSPKKEHLAAVYVHAGAGYHSVNNERIHLGACAAAANMGMLVLKNGGSALDAAEKAVKCLEDNEITNAGYGSNLTMDGTVECDATIVDHLGRSGAVGAVTNIHNPISVARIVYNESIEPLALRRVPPNLLTGTGATNFAFEHGVDVLKSEDVISPSARDRFEKWKIEIEMAKEVEKASESGDTHSDVLDHPELKDVQEAMDKGAALSQNATIAALANESQPFSPTSEHRQISNEPAESPSSVSHAKSAERRSSRRAERITSRIRDGFDKLRAPRKRSLSEANNLDSENTADSCAEVEDHVLESTQAMLPADEQSVMGSSRPQDRLSETGVSGSLGLPVVPEAYTEFKDGNPPDLTEHVSKPADVYATVGGPEISVSEPKKLPDQDAIFDTVGAIAVDSQGRIAAASSSGGIGMKHSGRIGPAALVGIGTAVVPLAKGDDEQKTVACVTSGTGEHIATSTAAQSCAMRVFTSTKVAPNGSLIETDEDDALKSFIRQDFMGHPGIRASHSAGAIGVMVVKKSRDGMWLYWAHNTDSFALASMHADDSQPHTAMSRSTKAGRITTGARSMRGTPKGLKDKADSVTPTPKRRRSSSQLTNAAERSFESPTKSKTSPAQQRSPSGRVSYGHGSRPANKNDGNGKFATRALRKE